METSLAWFYELEDRYAGETNRHPWSLSDWHNDPGDVVLPVELLSSITIDPESASKYRFLDTANWLKERVTDFYSNALDYDLPSERFAFCHNGTSSIHLVIQALRKNDVRRALVVTPAYFSVLSTLNQCGVTTIYHHLDLRSGLEVDPQKIITAATSQMVQAIFINGPIFSTGKTVPPDTLAQIIQYAEEAGVFVVVDETLAGLPWFQLGHEPYLNEAMRQVFKSPNGIYIYSATKSLFINGIKHSMVIGKESLIAEMEHTADHIMGGLTIHQMKLAANIYNSEYSHDINHAIQTNAARFRENYELCKATLEGTPLHLTEAKSGLHCIAYAEAESSEPVKAAKKIVKQLLFDHGYAAIPLSHFGFPPFSPVGFRINLSKTPGKLHNALGALVNVIHKNPDFFD